MLMLNRSGRKDEALSSLPDNSNVALPVVHIKDLRKVYVVSHQETGARATMQSLVRRRKLEIAAVDGISFDLAPGEIVGFLGPNGAGKTTTLKMLSGLLHPTSGEATVLGYVPWKREKSFLKQITLVMGQRNQLVWNIPALSSFELNRVISYPAGGLPPHACRADRASGTRTSFT